MSINFTTNTLIVTKRNYNSENLNGRDEKFFDPNQFKILRKKKNQSGLKEKLREMQKKLWFEINTSEFEELTRNICNNQDNNDFKIIINKRTYDLKNAKNIWTEATARKTTRSEEERLHNELIQKDIDTLEREKSNGFEKYNILNILNNVGSIFTGAYLHYKNVPKETMFERSIAERTKLRRERLDEIKRKEQNINNELFKEYFTDYQSPSNMYKKLSETEGAVNEVRVDSIKKVLSKLQRTIGYVSNDNAFNIEENEKIIDIVEPIFEFNQLNQSGQGLKILAPDQILSRLPISLAQLNARNNSEKLFG